MPEVLLVQFCQAHGPGLREIVFQLSVKSGLVFLWAENSSTATYEADRKALCKQGFAFSEGVPHAQNVLGVDDYFLPVIKRGNFAVP